MWAGFAGTSGRAAGAGGSQWGRRAGPRPRGRSGSTGRAGTVAAGGRRAGRATALSSDRRTSAVRVAGVRLFEDAYAPIMPAGDIMALAKSPEAPQPLALLRTYHHQ